MAAVSGIGAALVGRAQTGKGTVVDTSLLRTGIWTNFWDFSIASAFGRSLGARGRHARHNPLVNCYRAADGQVFWLLGLESQRHWKNITEALGHPEWFLDPRFKTAVS